jgi:hypothetical protein
MLKSLVQSAIIKYETRKNAEEKALPSDVRSSVHLLREHTHQNYSTIRIFVFATHVLSKSCMLTRPDTLIAPLVGPPEGIQPFGSWSVKKTSGMPLQPILPSQALHGLRRIQILISNTISTSYTTKDVSTMCLKRLYFKYSFFYSFYEKSAWNESL